MKTANKQAMGAGLGRPPVAEGDPVWFALEGSGEVVKGTAVNLFGGAILVLYAGAIHIVPANSQEVAR
jgi:hypothetical protein